MLNKKVLLFVAIGYTSTIAILSLISNDGIPYFGTNYEDKIYHFLAYAILNLLWYKVFFNYKNSKPILIAFVISIIYGIIIEVLQGRFTISRDSSIMDILANSFGVTIVTLFLIIKSNPIVKKK